MNRATDIHAQKALRCAALVFALCVALPAAAARETPVAPTDMCGNPFVNHFGPYDYRSATDEHLKLVENAHFTAGVESLTRPATTSLWDMGADVGYTLHVFPNHHRALITMIRLGQLRKSDMPPGAKYTVECYLIRALRFRPDDTIPRVLYANFLAGKGRKVDAMNQLKVAADTAVENPLSQYNIGLVYMEMKEYEPALQQAHKARAMGLNRLELEAALKAAGQWREP